MKQRELTQLVKVWYGRLGLEGWTIKARFKKSAEIGENEGKVLYSPEYRSADIEILRPEDRTEANDPIEETLIHELLHITIHGHKYYDGKYDPMFERGLNIISRALYKAYNND